MLLCPACGGFYGGERGLRIHQQAKHATDYGVAKDVVETAKQQLIVRPPHLLREAPAFACEPKSTSLSTNLSASLPGSWPPPVSCMVCDGLLSAARVMPSGWQPQRCCVSDAWHCVDQSGDLLQASARLCFHQRLKLLEVEMRPYFERCTLRGGVHRRRTGTGPLRCCGLLEGGISPCAGSLWRSVARLLSLWMQMAALPASKL